MSGYIGKIAAIVTANTSDFTAKLAGSKNELKTFAGSIQSTISSASNRAGNSFNAIFTPLQKLTRALDAGLRAPLELVDILEVRKLQTLVSLSEGLAKPLAGATRQFEQLSQQAQANFLPALIRSQTAVKALQTAFEATGQASGTGFEQARRQIEKTTQSVQRLAQAQQLASKTLTGNELQFRNPRLFQTLEAGAALSQQAAALPADRLQDGVIGRQTAALKQYQDAAVAAQARVENLQLTPNVDPSILKAAESQLLNLVKTAERARAQLNQSVNPIGTGFTSRGAAAGPAGLGLFGSQVGGEAEQAVARARTLSAEFAKLPQAAQAGLAGLAGIASRISDEVSQTGSGASQLQKVLDRLQQSIKQTQNVAASGSTALIIRPPDADVTITKTPRDLVGDFEQLQRDRSQARQQSASDTLGPALDDPKRQLDATVGRVAALKGQLDSLPASIRSQFIPAIKAAEAQLLALAGSSNATPAAIKKAADEAARLEAGYKRAKQALAIPTSGDFLGDIDAKRSIGELEALRGVLAQVGAQAGGPVAAAYDKYAAATRKAIANNTIGLPKVQAELRKIAVEAATAAAATGKISFGRALKLIERGGDVATKSFNNVGLAVNQLAFAVDDFFSVTGGIEQRIRAIGNNITQFGVIIGQTKGLVIALLGVLAAQGIAAFIKFSNGGAEAQDQTKALNEALAQQKSLVEDLARAFESLGETLTRGLFSEAGQEARELSKAVEDIRRKQQEIRDGRVVDLDPEVRRERAVQGVLGRRVEAETDVGRRIALQGLIDESRRREQGAAAAARDRPPPTAADVESGLRRTVFVDGARGQSPRNRQDLARIQQDVAGAQGDPRQLIELLRGARDEQSDLALRNAANNVRARPARQNVENLTRLIEGLERQIAEDVDEQAARLFESINRPAERVREAQSTIADAIEAGIPGAAALAAAVDSAAAGLQAAEQSIVERLKSGLPVDAELVKSATLTRDAAIRAFEAEKQKVAAIDLARQALDRFAEALSRASQEAQRNLSSAQSRADEARTADLGRSTPATRQAREQADAGLARQRELASGVEEEIAAARERVNEDVTRQAAIPADITRRRQEAERRFREENAPLQELAAAQQAFDPLIQQAEDLRAAGKAVPEELDRAAEDAYQRVKRAVEAAGLEGVDPNTLIAADQGVAQLEALQAALNATLAGLDAELQASGQGIVASFRRIAEIDELLQTQGVLGGGQREELARERAQLEQQAVEADEQVRRARDASTREAEQAAAADRGRELSMTDGERAARDLTSGLEDIRQFFGRQAEETTGLVDFEAQAAAQKRFLDESLRSAAPGIFALGDAVQNAVLQGPSRAALEATDVSTVEGASELNRLLRGDDAARDQDLVELQRQSKILEDMLEELRKAGAAGVAN
jgi:hypothetical protein